MQCTFFEQAYNSLAEQLISPFQFLSCAIGNWEDTVQSVAVPGTFLSFCFLPFFLSPFFPYFSGQACSCMPVETPTQISTLVLFRTTSFEKHASGLFVVLISGFFINLPISWVFLKEANCQKLWPFVTTKPSDIHLKWGRESVKALNNGTSCKFFSTPCGNCFQFFSCILLGLVVFL